MPLTLVQAYALKPPPPVVLITAGDDQLIACESTVMLTAVVDEPGNLPGHTLEWEQTGGNAVTLSCTDCLTTTFTTADQSEKTFRFWLDRNKPYEQYDDVQVTYTPFSTMEYTSQVSKPTLVFRGTPSDVVVCESIIATADIPPPVEQSAEVTAGGVGLVWDEPTAEGLESFITQYIVYEDDVAVATIPGGGERLYSNMLPKTYKIQTDFLVNGQPSTSTSCERDFLNDVEYPSIVAIDEVMEYTSQIAKPTVSFVKYGNIALQDNISAMEQISQVSQPTITFVKYGNISLDDNDSAMEEVSQVALPTVNITRYDSGGIGG